MDTVRTDQMLTETLDKHPGLLPVFQQIGMCCVNEEVISLTVGQVAEKYGVEPASFVVLLNRLAGSGPLPEPKPAESCCCAPAKTTLAETAGRLADCVLCGRPLVYSGERREMECAVCHKVFLTNAWCEGGHFVCDSCHSGGGAPILDLLQHSTEEDPIRLFREVAGLANVHMHGPEHHGIVPCVLLTAYHNCGGNLDLPAALAEAWKRGKTVPGGSCGFLGACGAAIGAGIYVSILTKASPLTADVWTIPQQMTLRCLTRITSTRGPRCCKRTTRFAIEEAAAFTKENFGIEMPLSYDKCTFYPHNRECLRADCPYFPA